MFLSYYREFALGCRAEEIVSYCRWLEGDLYAYSGSDGYYVHVAAHCVNEDVRSQYVEQDAAALLARLLWLGSKGCDYPWDALRYLKEDVIKEIDLKEAALRDQK
jgi:hypothetical protein